MLIDFKSLRQFIGEEPLGGVLHIGAHHAEELEKYVENGARSIIWVEANHNEAIQLLQRTVGHSGSSVHFFAAFDEDDKVLTLNVANNGESSSILKFGTHSKEHPHVQYVGQVHTPAWRIDSFMQNRGFDQKSFTFVNIDIQGAELIALKGMPSQLSHANYLYLEVNEKPLYEGCALIGELDEYLSSFGFERKMTAMTQHGWGDAFYVKENR